MPTKYSMTPISNGTRLRTDHNTFAEVIASYNANQVVEGDEVWESLSDGAEVRKGDKWLKVTSVDGVPVTKQGWMAYIHKSSPICDNFKVIESPVDPDPTPIPSFPQSFTLIEENGTKALYVFVKILE